MIPQRIKNVYSTSSQIICRKFVDCAQSVRCSAAKGGSCTTEEASEAKRLDGNAVDGTTLAIDCTAIEDECSNTPAQRAELDWLLYNKPLEYAQMVLKGEIEHYLSLGCDHGRSEN